MNLRKEITDRSIDKDGNSINFRYISGGLLIEDHMILLMKHFLADLSTKTKSALDNNSKDFIKIKNYLMRFYVNY